MATSGLLCKRDPTLPGLSSSGREAAAGSSLRAASACIWQKPATVLWSGPASGDAHIPRPAVDQDLLWLDHDDIRHRVGYMMPEDSG